MANWGGMLRRAARRGRDLLTPARPGGAADSATGRATSPATGRATSPATAPGTGRATGHATGTAAGTGTGRATGRATGTAAGTASRPAVRTAPTRDRARTIAYAPRLDGDADPGEIVWAWVLYEENDGRGKDRPLLVVGRDRSHLLALMLSSRHDRADDRNWLPVGSGDWDPQGRQSWVRLDRVLEVPHHGIRREGAVLGRDRFERVATQLRAHYGWS